MKSTDRRQAQQTSLGWVSRQGMQTVMPVSIIAFGCIIPQEASASCQRHFSGSECAVWRCNHENDVSLQHGQVPRKPLSHIQDMNSGLLGSELLVSRSCVCACTVYDVPAIGHHFFQIPRKCVVACPWCSKCDAGHRRCAVVALPQSSHIISCQCCQSPAQGVACPHTKH